MFRKSVEDFVGEPIAGDHNDRVVVQGNLLRNLCCVFPMCGDCEW